MKCGKAHVTGKTGSDKIEQVGKKYVFPEIKLYSKETCFLVNLRADYEEEAMPTYNKA